MTVVIMFMKSLVGHFVASRRSEIQSKFFLLEICISIFSLLVHMCST